MKFEFDREKSLANKKKHGIDFYQAQGLWDDEFRVEVPARNIKGESRSLVIALFNNYIWTAVVTYRNHTIRIISVRKSRDYEKEIYHSRRI